MEVVHGISDGKAPGPPGGPEFVSRPPGGPEFVSTPPGGSESAVEPSAASASPAATASASASASASPAATATAQRKEEEGKVLAIARMAILSDVMLDDVAREMHSRPSIERADPWSWAKSANCTPNVSQTFTYNDVMFSGGDIRHLPDGYTLKTGAEATLSCSRGTVGLHLTLQRVAGLPRGTCECRVDAILGDDTRVTLTFGAQQKTCHVAVVAPPGRTIRRVEIKPRHNNILVTRCDVFLCSK